MNTLSSSCVSSARRSMPLLAEASSERTAQLLMRDVSMLSCCAA